MPLGILFSYFYLEPIRNLDHKMLTKGKKIIIMEHSRNLTAF